MEEQILNIAIKHWNLRFTGISALDIAEELKISNLEAMNFMEHLCEKGEGTLNTNITLYQVKFNFDKSTNISKISDSEPIQTHIFFPSKIVLQKFYEQNLLDYFKDGEYKNRLRKGYGQIDLIYFDIKVLSKYLDNRELYDLNDDITGGVVRLNSDVISKMSQDEYDSDGFDKIWYGKRKLENGVTGISAILIDLSKLPVKEQSYWHGFELNSPVFVKYDPDFNKFIARAYGGEWVESNDPIKNIYKTIQSINNILPYPIFNQNSNSYLKYPTNNSFKAFADANSELYKVVGPDNLNSLSIKKIFLETFKGQKDELVHPLNNRPLSSMQVFQIILTKLNFQVAESFKEHWTDIKNYRIEGDHKITKPKKSTENYLERFRETCEKTADILARILNEIRIRMSS